MTTPRIAATQPIEIEFDASEELHWCACGRSASQPYCDGSHAGSGFTPVAFQAQAGDTAHLCMCKRTGNPPYCDGTHAGLADAQTGSEAAASEQTGSGETGSGAPAAAPTPEEPHVKAIHDLARDGLAKVGHHGPMGSMGVPRSELPTWDDIQILAAQFARKPLMDDAEVGTRLVIGPAASKPLELEMPLFVSDMSFGALSEEAKTALAQGAELAGTGICSGEGGMLPEEQAANRRYFYELASARFGFQESLLSKVQAFHFKGGQGAKTGTGGHLPGSKVTGKIAAVRGLQEGQAAVSPPTFADLSSVADFARFADRVRELTGGIPIGMKLSANHIEADIEFALQVGVDYIILDGRGGGTGAAPLLFRDHISVPTIPALARARHYLDQRQAHDVTLIITGGLRMPADFVKAMALGADGVALANSAMQAIGCVGARMCNSNNCPTGVATQKPELRARLDVAVGAQRLANFLQASTELMQVLARACGHTHLQQFDRNDITTWKKDMADLTGLDYAGFDASRSPVEL